jgi:hypothetical protein
MRSKGFFLCPFAPFSLTYLCKKNDMQQLIDVAKNYINIKELPQNSGFENTEFQSKMEKIGWLKGEAWCATFAKLVFSEAYEGDMTRLVEINQLFSKSAVKTYYNFDESDWKTQNPDGSPIMIPQVGALAVWRMGMGVSGHIGIVTEVLDNKQFKSIEGNTNNDGSREGIAVLERIRTANRSFGLRQLNLLGFILPKPKMVATNTNEKIINNEK